MTNGEPGATMTTMTVLPQQHGRPFTRADLESMPDDGRRYELIDGCLLVTPAPSPPHQTVVLELAVLLRVAAPPYAQTFVAPLDVVPADDTALQPDVLVARRADLTAKELAGAPLLAVEVLSRSTRSFDLGAKRERYERAGTPAYWVFDPDAVRLRAWELRAGAGTSRSRTSPATRRSTPRSPSPCGWSRARWSDVRCTPVAGVRRHRAERAASRPPTA